MTSRTRPAQPVGGAEVRDTQSSSRGAAIPFARASRRPACQRVSVPGGKSAVTFADAMACPRGAAGSAWRTG